MSGRSRSIARTVSAPTAAAVRSRTRPPMTVSEASGAPASVCARVMAWVTTSTWPPVTTRRSASCAATACGRGAGVEVQRAAEPVADDLERAAGDRGLRLAAPVRALGEGGLGDAVAIAGDRAAVHAAQGADALELVEVAADGLGGDLEATGEFDDADATLVEQQPLDELLALHCVHGDSSSNFPHVTTQTNTYASNRRHIAAALRAASVQSRDARQARPRSSRSTSSSCARWSRARRRAIPDAATLPLAHAADGWDCSVWRLGDRARRATPPARARGAARAARAAGARRASPRGSARPGVGVPAPIVAGRPGSATPGHGRSCRGSTDAAASASRAPTEPDGRRRSREALLALHVVRAAGSFPVNPVRGVPLARRAEAVAGAVRVAARAGAPTMRWRELRRTVGCRARGAAVGRPAGVDPRRPAPRQPRRPRLASSSRSSTSATSPRGDPAYDLAVAWLAFDAGGSIGVRRRDRRPLRRGDLDARARLGGRGHAACCSTRATTTPSTRRSAPRRWQRAGAHEARPAHAPSSVSAIHTSTRRRAGRSARRSRPAVRVRRPAACPGRT